MIQNIGLLFLRLFPSLFMIIGHGWPKLLNFSAARSTFPDPIGLGSTVSLVLTIIAEVFCPLLMILGLFSRVAAGITLSTMLVAVFIVHAADPWQQKELALVYGVFYLVILFTGPGILSIDQKKGII